MTQYGNTHDDSSTARHTTLNNHPPLHDRTGQRTEANASLWAHGRGYQLETGTRLLSHVRPRFGHASLTHGDSFARSSRTGVVGDS